MTPRDEHVRRPRGSAARAGGALVIALLAGPFPERGGADPPPPLTLPPGFSAQVFATGLGQPRALAIDPAGTLLVSLSAQGKVVALPERGDGRPVSR
jgi:glucose/arabinose dehydrogenase